MIRSSDIDRRSFLRAASAACGVMATRAWAFGEDAALYAWQYPLKPETVSRWLPAGATLPQSPEARIELRSDDHHAILSVAIHILLGEQGVWWELTSFATSERDLRELREYHRRPTKDAQIEFETAEGHVSANLRRRGRNLLALTATATDEPTTISAENTGALYARLNVDWGFGPIDPAGADWQIARHPAHEATQLSGATVDFPQTSFLDPLAELKPAGDIIAWRATAPPPAVEPAEQPCESPASALTRYDRANPLGAQPTPESWPDERSAWVWTPADTSAYRTRKEYRASSVDLVDVRIMIERERFFSLLPREATHPRLQPMLRVVGMRVDESEWTPRAYQEVWLLTYAFIGQSAGWYALAHHVSEGGDIIHGRETWGYPSKSGEPDVFLSLADFGISVTRQGRESIYTAGRVKGFTPGMSLSQFEIFGLRADPFPAPGTPATGSFVHQTWFYQGKRMTADPLSFEFESYAPAEGEPSTDPWHEIGPARVVGASVMEKGSLQRTPGRIVTPCADIRDYYRERGDGRLPGETTAQTPTFRVAKPQTPGS